ncbi:MAG: glycosyltransferase family 9 protein [Candidatus Binatia bacterium]
MKLTTQRWIDRYVGIPACFALTAIVKLLEVCGLRRREARPERVLFIELSEMGSTILASAAIQRLQDRYGDHEHCFVIFKRNAASLRLLGLFKPDQIFTIRDDSVWSLIVDVFHFVTFCRERRVDTVIDLELFSRVSSLLALLSGATNRVGFHNYRGEGLYRGEHLTHRVHYNPYSHMAQNFMALVESLESDPTEIPQPKRVVVKEPPPVRIGTDPEAWRYVRGELEHCYPGLSPEHRVVIVNAHAGNLLPLRMWPVERFAELVQRLLAADPRTVVVLMGIAEGANAARLITTAAGDPRCIDFVGRTRTLTDVIELFHQSHLLITNDSGPAHFATLTAIKSVTLFGPETPVLYGTLGEHAVDLYANLACSPCLSALNHRNSPCTDNQCLKAISVDLVFAEARRLLADPDDEARPAS